MSRAAGPDVSPNGQLHYIKLAPERCFSRLPSLCHAKNNGCHKGKLNDTLWFNTRQIVYFHIIKVVIYKRIKKSINMF